MHFNFFSNKYLSLNFSEVDECASSPCQNNAVCRDLANEFMCDCAAGYEGTLCQTGKPSLPYFLFFLLSRVFLTFLWRD